MILASIGSRLSPLLGVILRLVLGVIFVAHGYQKVFEWGIGTVATNFAGMGLPAFIAISVSFIELIGGAFVLIGFLTRLTSLLIALVMLGAMATGKVQMGLLGGFELDLALFAIALSVFMLGPSSTSVDTNVLKKELI